jgi:plastocyanin
MLSVRIVFALTAALVLAGLWLAFRPQPPAPAPVTEATATAVVAIQEKAFDLVVKDGKLVSGPAALNVRQGDQVTLRIQSNANDELHVHGYDLKMRIKAGDTATLQFAATRSGRFELELHRKHTRLGALEVYPR